MNWLKKTLDFGQKIKRFLKKRPSPKDMEESDWTSCCKGPILKKDLENNLWVCPGPVSYTHLTLPTICSV